MLSGILIEKIGIKPTLVISYVIAILGMGALILVDPESQFLLCLFILGSKFGVSQAFNVAYVGNVQIFPVSVVATSYGCCNICARICTIMAPYVAELKPEYKSEWLFVIICIMALIAGSLLR